MVLLTLILLLLAYTLGIATLVVQIICYIRKIEYIETIVLVISFLILLLSSAVLEFEYISLGAGHTLTRVAMYFFTIVLAYTIPLNTHRERILANRARRNSWVLIASVVMTLLLAASFIFHFENTIHYASIAFLNISIVYSMLTVIMSKPSLLIKHRERTERLSAIGIIVFMALIVSAGFLFYRDEISSGSLLKGTVILSVICIILCLLKLPDDILRLAMFGPNTRINLDELEAWNISAREKEVIQLLVQGKSYRDIAGELYISMPTVKTHVSHIYQKMKVRNKVELINLVQGGHTKV